jgi:hypothetical protein
MATFLVTYKLPGMSPRTAEYEADSCLAALDVGGRFKVANPKATLLSVIRKPYVEPAKKPKPPKAPASIASVSSLEKQETGDPA